MNPSNIQQPHFSPRRRTAFAFMAALCLSAPCVFAQTEPDPTKPDDEPYPEIQVPSQAELERDPMGASELLLQLSEQAEVADKTQNARMALSVYKALAQVVPDQALAFSRLCGWYQKLGERANALATCRRATGLNGVKLEDYLRYVALLLNTPDGQTLTPGEVAELDTVFAHLDTQQVATPEPEVLFCQLAVKLENAPRLKDCLQKLERKAPKSPLAFPYQFSLALLEGNTSRAREVIQAASDAGLSEGSIDAMEHQLSLRGGRSTWALWVLGVALAGVLAWALWQRRRRGMPIPAPVR